MVAQAYLRASSRSVVRFDFCLEPSPCLCPQGCSGRSCTAWRSWPASWRSGTATRSPAPTTSRGRAARSPARPGPLDFPSLLLNETSKSKLPEQRDQGRGHLGHCRARIAPGCVQLFAPVVLHLSSPSYLRMGPRPCIGPREQIPMVTQLPQCLACLQTTSRTGRHHPGRAGSPSLPLCK